MKKDILFLAVCGCIFMLSALPEKSFGQAPRKVVLEDYTGTWCGFCPKATTVMDDVLSTYPNAIGISNHFGDPLEVPYTKAMEQGFSVGGAPNGTVDRFKFSDQADVVMDLNPLKSKVAGRLPVTAPVSVNISSNYNSSTRALAVTVTANFVANINAALATIRINCVLTEDSVITTNSPQKNYYGQGCSFATPTSPWYNYPCSIPGFIHGHLARTNLASDPWGTAGVIPSSVTSGSIYSQTYNYTLPAAWDASQMSIVGFISYYSSNVNVRSILNANSVKLGSSTSTATGIIDQDNVIQIEVKQNTPNPFSDVTAIQFQLNTTDNVIMKVYDIYGKEVNTLINTKLVPGEHTFYWAGNDNNGNAVTVGVYYYTISTSTQSVSKPMIFINRY